MLGTDLQSIADRYGDIISDAGTRGLLIGVKLVSDNREFMAAARNEKLLVDGGGENGARVPVTFSIAA